MPESEPLMTRERLLAFLNNEVGVPISESTLDKLCAPSVGQGPPVAAYWGKRPLYSKAAARAWAESRLQKGRAA
jgi:hypothetical protein